MAQVRSAFVTDLKEQVCWRSKKVRLWAFGHKHFNCDLVEATGTEKRVLADQKGYWRSEIVGFVRGKVLGAGY